MTTIAAGLRLGAADTQWADNAACRNLWPIFDATVRDHPVPGQESVTANEAAAIRICKHRCPVAAQCLEWALETHEAYGVLGATTAWQRAKLRRNR